MQLIPQDQRLHHMDMHDKNPVSFIDPTVMVDQYHTEESLLTNQRAFEEPRSIDRLSFVHHKMVNNMNRSRQKYIITICCVWLFSFPSCSTKKENMDKQENKISRDIATEISNNVFELLGYDLNRAIVRIDSHPITIDSIMSRQIPCTWSNDTVWFEQIHNYLSSKSFWRCDCFTPGVLDGESEIYVDANTGRVLYIYPFGSPAELSKRKGRQNRLRTDEPPIM